MAKDPFKNIPDIADPEPADKELFDDAEDLSEGATSKGIMKQIGNFIVPILGISIIVWMAWPDPPKVAPKSKNEAEVDPTIQATNSNNIINKLKADANSARPTSASATAVSSTGEAHPQASKQPSEAELKMLAEAQRREEDIRASALETGGVKLTSETTGIPRKTKLDELQEEMLAASRAKNDAASQIEKSQELALASMNQNSQSASRKSANQSFLESNQKDSTYKLNKQQPAYRGHVIFEGTVIRSVLLTAINSDLPGTITAKTTSDVYDSVTQENILIPKGSTLIGKYNSEVSVGQERVLVAMNRLILPDGTWVSLSGSGATDSQGRSGLEADVNNHFLKMFGSSLVIGASTFFLGGRDTTTSTANGNGSTTTSGSILGVTLNETVKNIMSRNVNISPTLSKGIGEKFMFIVAHDLAMTPYRPQR